MFIMTLSPQVAKSDADFALISDAEITAPETASVSDPKSASDFGEKEL